MFDSSSDSKLLLFIGFVSILFVIYIIATRDLLKASVTEFYLHEMRLYETEIKARLKCEADVFQYAHHWPKFRRERYIPIFIRMILLFLLVLILPAYILYDRTGKGSGYDSVALPAVRFQRHRR